MSSLILTHFSLNTSYKMKRFTYFASALAATLLFTTSCETEDPVTNDPPSGTGTLVVDFDYVWAMAGAPFEMGTALYHPMTGDTLTYTTFKHYISNITLIKNDNTTWAAEESYHLLDFSDPSSTSIHLKDVPAGAYTGIQITFGVDSARNVSGAQTGALDPANGMFWSWNTGYIMIKAEGSSPQSGNGAFSYHLGGFSGENNCISVRSFNFPNGDAIQVDNNEQLTVNMAANPARLFHSYGSVANGAMMHMPSGEAATMAADFNSWVQLTDAF